MSENILVTNREGAERAFHAIGMTLHGSQIRKFTRNGREKIAVRFSTAMDGEVLNGVRYPAEVLADALYSFEGAPVPFDHPSDQDGRFLPARSNDGLSVGYIGGHMENVERGSVDSDPERKKIRGEMVFDLAKLMAEDHGKQTFARFEKGEPIETSTGLYIDFIPLANEGEDGAVFEAIWAYCDHNAILPPGVEPASPIEISGVFVNRVGGEEITLRRLSCHIGSASPAPVPVADPAAAIAANADSDPTFFNRLTKALADAIHGERGNSSKEADMADTDAKTEDVTNADLDKRVKDLEANALTRESVSEIVNAAVKPLIEANEKQMEANAKAEANERKDLTEKCIAANSLTQSQADATPIDVLRVVAGNAGKTDGEATPVKTATQNADVDNAEDENFDPDAISNRYSGDDGAKTKKEV